jgi:hypothetical protein
MKIVRSGGLEWSPDGQQVIYLKTDRNQDTLISRKLKDGTPRSLFSLPTSRLHDYLWLRDGRLLYILSEPGPVDDSCNIWRTRIDPRTGELSETPVQVTNWAGFCLDALSATSDSKRLVVQRWAHESNVLVADLDRSGGGMGQPRRLTLNDNYNQPEDWTADSSEILITSNRNRLWGLFRQARDSDATVPLVAGSEQPIGARISPNGAWVLYTISGNDGGLSTPISRRIMRVPLSGGVSERVLEASVSGFSCAKSAELCIFAEHRDDGRALLFTRFDPLKGRGPELARFDTYPAESYEWDLSPDGTRIAILRSLGTEIHILTVPGGMMKTVAVKGSNSLQHVIWRADGTGLLTTSHVEASALLLSVDLRGNSRVLWQEAGSLGTSAVPSRDGRHLAIMNRRGTDNIWMLENF